VETPDADWITNMTRTRSRHRRPAATYLVRGADETAELEISRAEGCLLFDRRGKRYIDFAAGWSGGQLGWDREELRKAVREFEGPDGVNPSFRYTRWDELAAELVAIAPGQLRKCYRATGGTEAVEIALQLAMASTGRRGFVAIEGSYHGNSIAAVSVAEGGALPGCRHLKPPLDEGAIGRLDRLLQGGRIAAFIFEPVICNLGVVIPDDRFMRAVLRTCKKHGTLLIADEVACGFGRTGRLFACEHWNLKPDLLCMAKGISGGHAALGATMATAKVAAAAGDDVSFYSTFGWHPLSVEVALANLRQMRRNARAIFENVEARSRDFALRLAQIAFPSPPKIRILGLAIGLEFEDEDSVKGLRERCRDEGLIINATEGVVTLFPPLSIDERTTHAGLDILERCAA
jgi:acetylornithine/succinyldiaminopimelate/putrescine aminotransferase